MATFKKLVSGKWQAQIARKGVRKSKSFRTKIQAKDWAAREEAGIVHQGGGENNTLLFKDALERYAREVSPRKRSKRQELLRINALCHYPIASVKLCALKASDFALWRDKRLTEVTGSSVNREMTIMSHALTIARREWGWIKANPMSDVRRPAENPPRDRRITDDEIERLLYVAGYEERQTPTTVTQRVAYAFLFALESGMRAGEIVNLSWDCVDMKKRIARLLITKNGQMREVPLSSRAIALLECLPKGKEKEKCFNITSAQLDVLFRKIRDKAAIDNLHFHDTRHEAITRLARKLDVLSLARMVGHRDIRMLQIYYNETAEELARKLG